MQEAGRKLKLKKLLQQHAHEAQIMVAPGEF